MSLGIDEIFELMSWDNDEAAQIRGIEEAKKIRHLSVLFQPMESKSVWENCAKVLADKSDGELKLYLIDMFEWLQDMNWPGADIIYGRLREMPFELIKAEYGICLSSAKKSGDSVWEKVLSDFAEDLGCSGNGYSS